MAAVLRSAYAAFIRNWIIILRAYPISFFVSGIFSGICSSVLAYFSYYLLAGGQIDAHFTSYTGTGDYISFVILGGCILSLSTGILLAVSRSLITEKREGTLECLLITPGKQFSYFIGITAQASTRCFGETLLLLLIVWPLGLNMSHSNLLTFLFVFPIAILGLFGMSTLLGALMLATGDTYVSQNTLFAAMTLLCGFVFPVNYLPLPLQWLGAALPVSGAVRLLRLALLTGTPINEIWPDILLYTVLGLVYSVVGLLLMPRAQRRALEGAY